MAIKCPVDGYEANTKEELISHAKQMNDDKHKQALKQQMGQKGGEAMGEAKDKAGGMMDDMKKKI